METSRRRITVTSSLKNIHGSAGGGSIGNEGRSVTPCSHSFLQKASGMIFIDDVNEFSSNSNICFMSGVFNMHTTLQYSIRTCRNVSEHLSLYYGEFGVCVSFIY